jgi:ABC-type multidrug transport system ATPase subunit
MLELTPLENTIVGEEATGGMSFEQKKRLSIAVELAANPSILFLDEPTTGLDSRSAQVVIRCIRRVASSGRSIVCLMLPLFLPLSSLTPPPLPPIGLHDPSTFDDNL